MCNVHKTQYGLVGFADWYRSARRFDKNEEEVEDSDEELNGVEDEEDGDEEGADGKNMTNIDLKSYSSW